MSLFGFLKARGSAPVARERLQILLAHERVALGPRDLVTILRDDLLATIARHIEIDPAKLSVKMDRSSSFSTLEIDVEIPVEKIASDGLAQPAEGKRQRPEAPKGVGQTDPVGRRPSQEALGLVAVDGGEEDDGSNTGSPNGSSPNLLAGIFIPSPFGQRQNIAERSRSFERVADLRWETAVAVEDDRKDYGERRLRVTGRIGPRLHVAVITYRGDAMRVISFRKANSREIKRYADDKNRRGLSAR